jgi:hypothetical protein
MSFVKALEAAAVKQGMTLSTAIELYSAGHFMKHLKPTAEDAKELIDRVAMMQRTLDDKGGDIGEEKESKGKIIGEKLGERIGKSKLMPADLYRQKIDEEEAELYNQLLVGGYDEKQLARLVDDFLKGSQETIARFVDLRFAAGVAIALQGLDYDAQIVSAIEDIEFYAPDMDGNVNPCIAKKIMVHTVRAALFTSGDKTRFIRHKGMTGNKLDYLYPSKADIDRMLEIIHEAEPMTDPIAEKDVKDEKLVTIKSAKA